jgi:hypothetical protein
MPTKVICPVSTQNEVYRSARDLEVMCTNHMPTRALVFMIIVLLGVVSVITESHVLVDRLSARNQRNHRFKNI